MNQVNQALKDQFIQGVKEAVSQMEKKASFQTWMTSHQKFREKFASAVIEKINQMKDS